MPGGVVMRTVVKTRIIRIGNSQGIRIPKLLLEQAHLSEDEQVELELQPDQIIVRPAHEARDGWDAAFERMAERGDDELLDADLPTTSHWDEEEWEW